MLIFLTPPPPNHNKKKKKVANKPLTPSQIICQIPIDQEKICQVPIDQEKQNTSPQIPNNKNHLKHAFIMSEISTCLLHAHIYIGEKMLLSNMNLDQNLIGGTKYMDKISKKITWHKSKN